MISTVTEQRRTNVSLFIMEPIACIFDSSITFLTFTMFFSQEGEWKEMFTPIPTPRVQERERLT